MSRIPRLRARFAMAAVLAILAGGCGSSSPSAAPPPTAPSVAPAGARAYTGGPGPASAPEGDCTPSLPALNPLPAPGAMPAGSYEATIAKRGYLIGGVDDNTYLWGYRDPATGSLTGFDIDMLHQVSQAIFGHPDQIHFVVVPNADRITDVQSGKVDVVAETMTITCARKKSVDFSTVYYDAGQTLLVPDGSTIKSYHDLGGKRVCAIVGSTSLQNLAALKVSPPMHLVQVTNQTDCLVMLQQGEIDAISTDNTILQGLAAQDPNVKLVGNGFTNEPYGMAINESHPDFVSFVNAVLAKERADGTWTGIYKKWLWPVVGGTIPSPPRAEYQIHADIIQDASSGSGNATGGGGR
jgi:polar amino acid transport system substrate-binding protein